MKGCIGMFLGLTVTNQQRNSTAQLFHFIKQS